MSEGTGKEQSALFLEGTTGPGPGGWEQGGNFLFLRLT